MSIIDALFEQDEIAELMTAFRSLAATGLSRQGEPGRTPSGPPAFPNPGLVWTAGYSLT